MKDQMEAAEMRLLIAIGAFGMADRKHIRELGITDYRYNNKKNKENDQNISNEYLQPNSKATLQYQVKGRRFQEYPPPKREGIQKV
jgi:hypothetical protein